MKFSFIAFIVFFITITTATDCTFDWQCGSPPFTICQNKVKVLQGLGYDRALNKVIFVGRINQTNQVVVGSVPGAGGALSIDYQIKSDNYIGDGYTSTFGMQAYVQSTKLVYTMASQRLSPVVGPYIIANQSVNGIWYTRGYTLATLFDESQNRLYYCDFGLERVNYLPTSYIEQSNIISMLNLQQQQFKCNFISRVGQTLYLVQPSYEPTFKTNIVNVNSDCVNCSTNSVTTLASVSSDISGFGISDNYIYYGANPSTYSNDSGVYQLPINGDTSKLKKIANGNVQGLVMGSNGDLFYSTTDGKIFRLNLSTGVSTLLYSSDGSSSGSCGCSTGFTGGNCQACDNGIVRWTNGVPECVPLMANGQPLTCAQDYECGEVPKAICNSGRCACRSYFTGNRCQNCAGTVTWDNYGNPQCNI